MRTSTTSLAFIVIISTLLLLLPSSSNAFSIDDALNFFAKRRGGGRSGGVSSGGGRVSSGSSSGGSTRGPRPNTEADSNTGGFSPSGSGVAPAYGSRGRRRYAGGGKTPYKCGARSREGKVTPQFYSPSQLGFWGGAEMWPRGAYRYRFGDSYEFDNATTGEEEEVMVDCFCARYGESSCAYEPDDDYVEDILGDGTYETAVQNQDLYLLANVDDQKYLYVNGSLPNGTTAASMSGLGQRGLIEGAVWWVIAGVVAAGMWSL